VPLGVAQETSLPIATVQFPPFSYADDKQKLHGVGSEIVNMVFNELNYTANIDVMPTKRAQLMVAAGKYAGMYMVTKSSQREQYCHFSEPLSHIADVFFKKKSVAIEWDKLSDLSNYIIGATDGYNYAPVFLDAINSGTLKADLIASQEPELQHLRKLEKGRIDLAICERSVCSWLIKEKGFNSLDFISKPIGSVRDFHICFSKKWENVDKLLEKFNTVLAKLKQNGMIKKVYKKYGVIE